MMHDAGLPYSHLLRDARLAAWEGFLADLGDGDPTADDEIRAESWSDGERTVPWWILRAVLDGEPAPPCIQLIRSFTLPGEMMTDESIARIIRSGLRTGLRELAITSRPPSLDAVWTLLDASPRLRHVALCDLGPVPDAIPATVSRPTTVRLTAMDGRWLKAMSGSPLFERVQALDVVGLQSAGKAVWPSVPIEKLSSLAVDQGVLPVGMSARVLTRLSAGTTSLTVAGDPLPDAVIEHINALDELRNLDVCRCRKLGDRQLAMLGPALARLEHLNLSHATLSRDGVKSIVTTSARLKAIDVSGTRLDGDALRELVSGLETLEALAAGWLSGTPDEFAVLGPALAEERWRRLTFEATPVDDRVGTALRGSRLSSVSFRNTKVGRATGEHLLGGPGLEGLRDVDLDYCALEELTPPGNPRPHLVALSLRGTRLEPTDPAAILHGERLPALTFLDLHTNRLGPEAASALADISARNRMRVLRISNTPRWKAKDFAELFAAAGPSLVELVAGRDGSGDAQAIAGLANVETPALARLDLSECVMAADTLQALLEGNALPRLEALRVTDDEPGVGDVLASHPIIGRLRTVQLVGEEWPEVLEQSPLLGRYALVSQ